MDKSTLQKSIDEMSHQPIGDFDGEVDLCRRADAMYVINSRLRSTLDEAPSDATAEFEVRRWHGAYRGLLKIYSNQRRFVSGSRKEKFVEVIDDLFSQIHEQLLEWKRDRFAATASS